MREIWRGECSECEMAVEWEPGFGWQCCCIPQDFKEENEGVVE